MTIVKPLTDKREYEAVYLQNGLSVLLIHDPDIKTSMDDEKVDDNEARKLVAKKAAAAMCVNVGTYSDPWDAQGLAHFLEHMLFMGNTRFPHEDEFSSFLAKHGGLTNAATTLQHTCFYFNVHDLYLKPSLERFSCFFVSPLFKESSIAREIQSVNSEFIDSLQSDRGRLDHMKNVTGNTMHTYSKFQCGNNRSLNAINKCGKIRERLTKLYTQYYRANHMKLVVLGGEPLHTLKQWVMEYFEDIPKGNTNLRPFMWSGSPWSTGKISHMESVENSDTLELSWMLPVSNSEYLKKENEYIIYLINREARASLLRYLRSKRWATKLTVVAQDKSSIGYVLRITITLTLCGKEKVFDIINSFFEFIRMLREQKPQKWIYDELCAVSSANFQFSEKEATASYVTKLAKNMHHYPEHHVLYGGYAYEKWDPLLIDDILSRITPTGMRIDVLCKSFDRNAPGVIYEPWSGIPYTVIDVPDQLMSSWTNLPCIDPELFHIPVTNEFISRDFSLQNHDMDSHAAVIPIVLKNEPLCRVWYKLDQTFKTPRANVYLSFKCGSEMHPAQSKVLLMLYVSFLSDTLNETLYMASQAGLYCSLSILPGGIGWKLQGYSKKLGDLAYEISASLKNLVVQKDHFQIVKEEIENAISNTGDLDSNLTKEMLVFLSNLTWENVYEFMIPSLFTKVYIEALCHGNLSQKEALKIVKSFEDVLEDSTPLPHVPNPLQDLLRLTPIIDYIYNQVSVNNFENSVVEKCFDICHDLGAHTIRAQALTHLFLQVTKQPFQNQLRTVEQLGYSVSCGSLYSNRAIGLWFSIESPNYSPIYIRKRMDAFFYNKLQEYLEIMSDEDFQHFKDSLVASRMQKDNYMIEETDRYWKHILDKSYMFDVHERESKALKDIQRKDLVQWYNHYIRPGGFMRRSMCLQLWGCKFKEEGNKQPYEHIDYIVEGRC